MQYVAFDDISGKLSGWRSVPKLSLKSLQKRLCRFHMNLRLRNIAAVNRFHNIL